MSPEIVKGLDGEWAMNMFRELGLLEKGTVSIDIDRLRQCPLCPYRQKEGEADFEDMSNHMKAYHPKAFSEDEIHKQLHRILNEQEEANKKNEQQRRQR